MAGEFKIKNGAIINGSITGITEADGDNSTKVASTAWVRTRLLNSGYLTGITSSQVTTALGYIPYNSTNPSGYITGITSGNVTTALGYTPYNSTNPSGYITSSGSISGTAAYATQWGTPSGYANFSSTAISASVGWLFGTTGNGVYAPVSLASVSTLLGLGSMAFASTGSYYLASNPSGYITSAALTPYLLKSGGIMSGPITLASISGTDQTVENTFGDYLHLGAWGVARTAVNAVLVNTAYMADYATNLFDMNISRFTNNSGYITSSALSSYLPLSGGTLTGSLTINTTGDIVANGDTFRIKGAGGSAEFIWYKNYSGDPAQPGFVINNRAGATTFSHNANGGGTSVSGNFSAANFSGSSSGTNTGDQTSVTGNAGTVGGYAESAFWRDGQSRTIGILNFSGVGTNSGNANQSYAIYQEGGAWAPPFPDLCIGFHTGIKIGAYYGYNGTRFYNNSDFATQTFSVNDGDNHVRVAYNLYVTGTITGSNLSGTNTGDQTNISGNAATATTASTANSVAWSNISAGVRDNYNLTFQPPSNSYAGLTFNTSTGIGAGYILIRGTSDDDVYTAEGITFVADAGWLTLSQRTASTRGVRIMTGSSTSVERAKFLTDGQIQFVNGTGFTYNGNTILHAANYNSYAPTLAGGGASGTWGISISGASNSTALFNTNFGADIESVTSGGIYRQESPSSGYSYTTTLNMSSSDGRQQLTIERGGGGMKFRGTTTGSGTSWNPWRTVMDSSNIGSQSVSYASSAGNSDTVDGLHASSFVRNDTTGQYLRAYYQYGSYLTTESPTDFVNQGLSGGGLRVDFMNNAGGGNWNHVITWSGYNAYNMYQLGGYYDGGSATNLYVRSEANHGRTSWTAWRRLLNESSDPYAVNMNQYVRTSDGPTFTNIYNNGWFRNNNTNEGVYSQPNGNHFYSTSGSDWVVTGAGGGVALQFRSNHQSTVRGYVHGDTSSNFGLLDNTGSWQVRLNPSNNGGQMYGNWLFNGAIRRNSHVAGFLEGGYNNLGANDTKSSPIYTIGSSYNPTETTLGSMYGIGYAHPNFWGSGKVGGWGMYVANNGIIDACIGGDSTSSVGIWSRLDIVAYSDARVKENVEVIPDALEKIKLIRGVTFTRTDIDDKTKRHAGVIAQEVLPVLPEVVSGTEEDFYSVAYGNMGGLFIEAIKELAADNKDLRTQINELKKLIS